MTNERGMGHGVRRSSGYDSDIMRYGPKRSFDVDF